MRGLWQDLRIGARMLFKRPGFAIISVLVLAIGIGANTAIFSIVNTVLLRPLPYRDGERLVMLWERAGADYTGSVSPNNFIDWRAQSESFEEMAVYRLWLYTLTGTNEPTEVNGMKVSANFFSLLGVAPQLGRDFLPDEDALEKRQVAIISHGFWQRRFGGSASVIGERLRLDDGQYTIVGVLAPDFRQSEIGGDYSAEVWTPEAIDPAANQRGNHYLRVIGRLKAGVTIARAQAEMERIARGLAEAYPETNRDRGVNLVALHEEVAGGVRRALIILQFATGLVLLIACANIANLLLARMTLRGPELAIRAALGASRSQIVRLLVAESAVLAAMGGAAGLLLAYWALDLLLALAPRNLPRLDEVSVDASVLGFTLGLSLLTVLLFGLGPAWHSARINLDQALRQGRRGSTRGQGIRSALVVAEVALTIVLLIGATLLLRSLVALQQVDLGFKSERLLTMRVSLLDSKYPDRRRVADYYRQLVERVRNIPGVEEAAVASDPPMIRLGGFWSTFEIEGQPAETGRAPTARYGLASPGFFRALEIAILKGRAFDERDTYDAPQVALVSQNFARRYFPGAEPLGRKIIIGRTKREIVGVVADVKHESPAADEIERIYVPHAQNPRGTLLLFVRTAGAPESLASAAQKAVWEGDPDAAVSNVGTMEEALSDAVSRPRFNALLVGIFAALALLLAAVGIYGVMSFTVTEHTREIGIRMALGAQATDVLKLIIGQGLALALFGIGAGLLAAFALTRLLENLLFGVSATDPATFALVALIISAVALLACYLPARRATRVDPMVALRYE